MTTEATHSRHRNVAVRSIAGVAGACLIAGLGIAATAAPAQATAGPIKYTINDGTFTLWFDGQLAPRESAPAAGTFSGSFVFDSSKCTSSPCPTAYSQVNITTSAATVSIHSETYRFVKHTYTDADIIPGDDRPTDANGLTLTSGLAKSASAPRTVFTGFSLFLAFAKPLGNPGSVIINPGNIGPNGSNEIQSGAFTQSLQQVREPSPIQNRAVNTGTVVGVQPTLKVAAVSAATKLPRSGTKTVVRAAAVKPRTSGKLQSIRVQCAPNLTSARGDVRYCSATKNLKTGKVTVTTFGIKNVQVTVTIKEKSKWAGFPALTWTRTWSVA